MKKLESQIKFDRHMRIGIIFLVMFLLQVVVCYYFVQTALFSKISASLTTLSTRIENDLKYKNGRWDTTLYNSDPNTPYFNAPSPFPLYIITADGFVIERSLPIHGLLDSSDYKHLSAFSSPQLIDTITNEKWRVLSKPIIRDGKTMGVILVANFNPETVLLKEIDAKLQETVNKIDSTLIYKKNKIDVTHLDIRHLPYDMTFEIVDKYNKVILNHGRTPSYIDPSYVIDQFNKNHVSTYVDRDTNEMFLMSSKTLYDAANNPIGVVIIGRSISDISNVLLTYLAFSCVAGFVLSFPFAMTVYYFMERNKGFFFIPQKLDLKNIIHKEPKSIVFDKKNNLLIVDDRFIELAPNTNQFELAAALFEVPGKKWSQDTLLERFNEEISEENWRKVYDSHLAINKKSGVKLVMYKNKEYMISSQYLKIIEK